MANIGFLGTGNMGLGMAQSLIDAGHSVRVYSRTEPKTDPLIKQGASSQVIRNSQLMVEGGTRQKYFRTG